METQAGASGNRFISLFGNVFDLRSFIVMKKGPGLAFRLFEGKNKTPIAIVDPRQISRCVSQMKSLLSESPILILEEWMNIFLHPSVVFQVLHMPKYNMAHLFREKLSIKNMVGSVIPNLLVLKLASLSARNEEDIAEI